MSPQTKVGGKYGRPITCPPPSQDSTSHVFSFIGYGMAKEPYKRVSGSSQA
jgi:hypothetical protein